MIPLYISLPLAVLAFIATVYSTIRCWGSNREAGIAWLVAALCFFADVLEYTAKALGQ